MDRRVSGERDGSDEDGSEQDPLEQQSFLPPQANHHRRGAGALKSGIPLFTKVMAVANLLLAITLATFLAIVANTAAAACPACEQPATLLAEPWSPALGAIVPVIRRFKPEEIFQSETSDLVEEAWKTFLGDTDGFVALKKDDFIKLEQESHESVASVYEPDKRIYGMSMYQQLNCLNIIRKSFYRHKFYPSHSDTNFYQQKNYCFDFLRQAIQCHGDVTMTYRWNDTYATTLPDGTQKHSDWYENADAEARMKGASWFWDVEHSCRMTEPIREWVRQHPAVPPGTRVPEDQDKS